MSNVIITAIATALATALKAEVTEALIAAVTAHVNDENATVKQFKALSGIRKVTKKQIEEAVAAGQKSGKPNRREFAKEWRGYAVTLIKSAKHTRKDIIAKAVEKFEGRLSEIAIATYLSDAKNKKYYKSACKLEKRVVVAKDTKVMSFAK